MKRTAWFERTFPTILDNGVLLGILERLDGTPVRLRAMVAGATPLDTPHGWSAAKELGHFADLEPLWLKRAQDILAGSSELTAADLTNRVTHDADHDGWALSQLVDRFEPRRRVLVATMRAAKESDLERAARHPRLGTPMRLVDLAFFVAEHDDHHMARLRTLLKPAGRLLLV
jgi:uncharacterized damage-inducible protein DinB